MDSNFYSGEEKLDLKEDKKIFGEREMNKKRFLTAKIAPLFAVHEWGIPLYQWNMNLLEIFEDKYIFVGCGIFLLRFPVLWNGAISMQPDRKKQIGQNIHFLKRGRLCGIEVVAVTHEEGGIEIFNCESFERIGNVLHRPPIIREEQADFSVWSMDMRGNLLVTGSNTHILEVIKFSKKSMKQEKDEVKVEKVEVEIGCNDIMPLSTSDFDNSGTANLVDHGGEPENSGLTEPSSIANQETIPLTVQGDNNLPSISNNLDGVDNNWQTPPLDSDVKEDEEELLLKSRTIRYIRGHQHNIPSVELNARGDLVLTGSIDTAVRISDVSGGVLNQNPEELAGDEGAGGSNWVWRALWISPDAVWQIPYIKNTSLGEAAESIAPTTVSPSQEMNVSVSPTSADDKPSRMETTTSTVELTIEETLPEKPFEDEIERKCGGMILEENSAISNQHGLPCPSTLSSGQLVRQHRPPTPPPLSTYRLLKRAAISNTMRKLRGVYIPPWLVDIIVAYADETYILVTTTSIGRNAQKKGCIRIHDSKLNILMQQFNPLSESFNSRVNQFHRLNFCFRLPGSPVYCIASPACQNILLVGVAQGHNGVLMLKHYGEIEFDPPSNVAPLISPYFITGVMAVQVQPWVYRLYVTRTGIFQIMRGFIEAYTIELQLPA